MTIILAFSMTGLKIGGFADINVIANYVGEYELPENVKVFLWAKKKAPGKSLNF